MWPSLAARGSASERAGKWEQRYSVPGRAGPTAASAAIRRKMSIASSGWRLGPPRATGSARRLMLTAARPAPGTPEELREALLAAASRDGRDGLFEALLDHALALYPLEESLREIICPCLVKLGRRGQRPADGRPRAPRERRDPGPARTNLAEQRGAVRGVAVLACAPDELHELTAHARVPAPRGRLGRRLPRPVDARRRRSRSREIATPVSWRSASRCPRTKSSSANSSGCAVTGHTRRSSAALPRPRRSRSGSALDTWAATSRTPSPPFGRRRDELASPSGRGGGGGSRDLGLLEPLDKRLLRCHYSDIAVLGKAVTRGNGWRPLGFAIHAANGAAFADLRRATPSNGPTRPAARVQHGDDRAPRPLSALVVRRPFPPRARRGGSPPSSPTGARSCRRRGATPSSASCLVRWLPAADDLVAVERVSTCCSGFSNMRAAASPATPAGGS